MSSHYTIDSVNKDGSVDVTFSIDKKSQNISRLPIDSAESLTEALDKYAIAYEEGLAVEAAEEQVKVAHPDVLALVGKTREVESAS